MSAPVAELEHRFKHHPPTDDAASRHEHIRHMGLHVALELRRLCPHSRELSLALTKLEEVTMWGNAAIARNHDKLPPLEDANDE